MKGLQTICKINIEFTTHRWEDFNYWLDNDPDVLDKIKELIKSIRQEPFQGIKNQNF
ncbi:type II toxin-antitoxin system YoeB family toxin [Flavobacterium sp.]|uniref:type II toxin-antitoxin system YoeB family toxin n=1 Tax=Flavobacterium sp. TaxID=239 RepID=UPI0037C14F61